MSDLREVTQADVPQLTRLFAENIETSMFPLTNLKTHGLGGSHPRGVTGWCLPDHSGALLVTNEGMAMPQMPGAGDDVWRAAARRLGGRKLSGILGAAEQARALQAAAGLADAPVNIAEDEPGLRIDLAALKMPRTEGLSLHRLDQPDAALLTEWRTMAHVEALGTPPDKARAQAERDIAGYIANGTHRVLRDGGQPVAMTGFNAVAEDAVQIGAVFTPAALRNRGYARAAVSLHLKEAQAAGYRRAVLFAASKPAVRAYLALGFEPYGAFSLILFAAPEQVQA